MSGYEPLVRWDLNDRGVYAQCRHCTWHMTGASIANVRMHVLANPTHRILVVTTSSMEFRHAIGGMTAHVG